MKPRLRDERGQAAIFMALFVSTMIMLFAFTTNIGMLVHAKINLQNAADAAAYSGAAVQARQLTNAAYLNWEMRRALKEFLFYYTVRGQFQSMPCFPLDATGAKMSAPWPCEQRPGTERYYFDFDDPREHKFETGGPYLPTTCIIFDSRNNYCQKDRVAGIPEFPKGGGWGVADPIVAAVRTATEQIIEKKLLDCYGRTDINRKFLLAWLFNLNPVRGGLEYFSIGRDTEDPFPVNGLDRLGVLPRNALLRARIDNIEEALNLNLELEGMSPNVTEQTMGALRGSGKPLDYFERPIQAFLSAKNNLPTVEEDNGNFTNIKLIELLPNRPANVDHNPNLKNPAILVKFNDIMAKASFANSLFKDIAGMDAGNCVQFRELRTITGFPFGITKDPSVLTYYAVRLEAKARLLFSPFGGNGMVTLSAYSAAKPFGSRIGRNLTPQGDSSMGLRMILARALIGRQYGENKDGGIVNELPEMFTDFTPTFPNVLVEDKSTVFANEINNSGSFTTNAHLGYLRGAVATLGRLDLGPRLAGAYAPWEVGYYTPPATYQSDEIIGKFEDNPIYGGKFFTLTAPLYPVNATGSRDLTFIRTRVGQYLNGDIVDTQTINSGEFANFLKEILSDSSFDFLENYLEESRESTFHFIPDPLLSDEPHLQAYAKAVGSQFTVAGMPAAYKRQLTSWNNQKTATDGPSMGVEKESELGLDMGRSGYSVRFISFDSLKEGGQGTNDPFQVGIQWTNPLDRLDGGGSVDAARIFDDLAKLKH